MSSGVRHQTSTSCTYDSRPHLITLMSIQMLDTYICMYGYIHDPSLCLWRIVLSGTPTSTNHVASGVYSPQLAPHTSLSSSRNKTGRLTFLLIFLCGRISVSTFFSMLLPQNGCLAHKKGSRRESVGRIGIQTGIATGLVYAA